MSAQQNYRKSEGRSDHYNDDQEQQNRMLDGVNGGEDDDGGEEEQELNEEEIVQVIIQLGNEILRNLGVEEPIDDVAVFFSDEFYIQFFQAAFPEIDFSQLTAGQDVNEMAENIQALIDLLGEQILKYDLGHIKGEEIVHGNPEHCINLLQLVQEISVMIQTKGGAGAGGLPHSNPGAGNSSGDGELNSLKKQLPQLVDDSDDFNPDENDYEDNQGEDDEAQLISDPQSQKRPSSGGRSSGRAPGGPQGIQNNNNGANNHQQFEMDGGAYDDDMDDEMTGMRRSVEFDEEEIRNQFGNNGGGSHRQHHNLDEEDDDELEQQLMQQLQNQPEILQKKRQSEDLQDQDDDDEPMDDDELQMYEQFLANNKQQEQQLAIDMDAAENHHGEEEDEDNEEIDIDNIDYDQLDPQILELAQQMGVHPKEVLKQIMQMNENGEIGDDMMMDGNESQENGDHQDQEDEDEQQMDDDEDDYGMDMPDFQQQQQEQASREEQLRREKEQFKMQMMGKAQAPQSDHKSQGQQKVHPEPSKQQQQQHYQIEDDDDYGHDNDDDDDESYYSEGEMQTRVKLINQKSYSAPYLIASDCYEEPLCDDEDDDSQGQLPSKAYSTTVLQSLQVDDQHHLHQQDSDQQDTHNLLLQQQQKLQQKQSAQKNNHNNHNNLYMQTEHDEDDVDVDISQKLLELQQQQQQQQQPSQKKSSSSKPQQNRMQQQQQQRQQHQNDSQDQDDDHDDDGEEEEEGEEDEDEMMIDLDQLDEQNREMLLEYLKQEYDKNPGQFQIPKELIEGFINKKSGGNGGDGNVKDIKSQEMVLEDASAQQESSHNQIIGGGQAIEDEGQGEDEIHEDDEDGAEYLDDHQHHNHQNNNDVVVDDDDDVEEEQEGLIGDINQQQLYQQQMMMLQQQQQMQQLYQQQQQQRFKPSKKAAAKGKKGKKAANNNNIQRPKSAGRAASSNNKKQGGGGGHYMMPLPNNVMTNIVGQQVQHEIIQEEEDDSDQNNLGPQIPEDQLQQIIQLLQDQQIDLENVDPNLIQQLLIAQQQQNLMQGGGGVPPQVLAAQSQPRSGRQKQQQRPGTASRKRSGSKKGNGISTKALDTHIKSFKPYSQGQLAQAKNKLASVYPAQVSERLTSSNKKRVQSAGPLANAASKMKKKRPMTGQQKQLKLQQQQLMQIFPQLNAEEQQLLIQQGLLPQDFIIQQIQLQQLQQQQQQQQQQQLNHQPLMVEDQDDPDNQDEQQDDEEDDMGGLEQPEVADLNTLQPQINHNPLLEIPNFTKEYLNQLSEEQLEQLVQQQQQLMYMQNLQQQQKVQQHQFSDQKPMSSSSTRKPRGISRPKSAKTQGALKSLRPASASKKSGITNAASYNGFQPYIAKSNTQKKLVSTAAAAGQSKMSKKKKSKRQLLTAAPVAATAQGVLMNNFFPALEGGGDSPNMYPDPRYTKYQSNGAPPQNNPNMMVQDQIDEVPREEEEAESQENIHQGSGINPQNFYHPANININPSASNQEDNEGQVSGDDEEGGDTAHGPDQDNADPGQSQHQDQDEAGINQASSSGIELSDEQLFELLQNYQYLSPEQQQQLQIILEQRTPEMLMMQQQLMQQQNSGDRQRSYQNIYDILMENVKRAKDRLAPLGQVSVHQHRTLNGGDDTEETDRRIIRQKQEFETLYRQYQNELKARELKKKDEDSHVEKRVQRESRIQAIRERKFHDELLSHQKSLNYKRNAQQVMLCQKVYKLASELEKNKLLQEKRDYKENQEKKKLQNKLMVDAIETYYKNQVQLLKERIESERFERRVAQQAQQQALTRMKRELNDQKKREVDRYLQLLKQEDNRYEFESSNINKIEHEIVKMYKKGK